MFCISDTTSVKKAPTDVELQQWGTVRENARENSTQDDLKSMEGKMRQVVLK